MSIFLFSILTLPLYLSNSVSQITCPRGTFQAQPSLQCVSCPPGTFQSTVNASFCAQCPPGRFQPFSAAQTAGACRPCQPGTFSPSASAACFPCPSGLSSTPASATCVTCQPGTFLSGSNSSSFQSPCQPCMRGFTDMPNQLSCTACPSGFVAPVAASSKDQCTITCPPGTQSSASGCQPCSEGTFSPDGKRCRTCAAGTVSNRKGASSCTKCLPGERAVLDVKSSTVSRCEPCPPGTTTFASGALICRQEGNPCPRGYLQLSSGDCIRCPIDHFFDATSEQCVPCDDGDGSAGGLPLSCTSCRRIVSARIKDSRCFSDAVGTVVVSGDLDSCPPGTMIDERLGVCVACQRGSFSATANMNKCTLCPAGSVQPNVMAKNCIPCPSGTVPDEDRVKCVVPQTTCPIGTNLILRTGEVQEENDAKRTALCLSQDCDSPPTNVTLVESRTCGRCKRNQSLDAKMSCNLCPLNSISDGKFCVECPSGFMRDVDVCACRGVLAQNKGLVSGVCRECPPGSYGYSLNILEAHQCVQCPAGTYRDLENDFSLTSCDPTIDGACPNPAPCKNCPPNTITREPGSTRCEPCPQGTFSYGLGETECLREGGLSESVSFTDPLGTMDDSSIYPEQTSTEPVPDETDDMPTTPEPEESQRPEMEPQISDRPTALSDESVSETREEVLESLSPFE